MIILSIQRKKEFFTFIKPVHSAWPRFRETGTQTVPVDLSVYQLSLLFKGVAAMQCDLYAVQATVLCAAVPTHP